MQCPICDRGCRLSEGGTGACGMYREENGELRELHPDRYLVACPISIETMPTLHYFPGGKFLQISTTGCNFDCPGCVSTVIVREMSHESRALRHLPPEQVVDMALENGCLGVVFLMNDPLASLPSFLRVARLARAKGLRVGCASNGYFSEQALEELIPVLDFINIGVKGLDDAAYRACGAPGSAPVLRNIRRLHEAGVHLELACILRRDNADELRELARRAAALSPRIPLLVMRFIPLEGADIRLEPTIREAEAFCTELRATNPFTYLFNSPGTELLSTVCPGCGKRLYVRDFYGPMGAKMRTLPQNFPTRDACPHCGAPLGLVACPPQTAYQEGDFEGGYPLTRALEMIEAILIALGVDRKADLVRAWEVALCGDGLKHLHRDLQSPRSYIGLLRHFGALLGREARSEELATFLEERLARVETAVASAKRRPRTYYAMGKPLFRINGGRMENALVETAGGHSVNRECEGEGRPGRTLTPEEFIGLAPEVIFVSAFISAPPEDIFEECCDRRLDVPAVRDGRIYAFPAPGWDFGSPRWILGLMFIAQTLHPERCAFDLEAEAEALYRCFYGLPFDPSGVNRSFAKPTAAWRWKDRAAS